MKFETWMGETLIVTAILSIICYLNGNQWIEWIGTAAVIFTFKHASIADRLAERQGVKKEEHQEVKCYKKLHVFYYIKEVLWLTYFLIHKAYAPIVGVAIFLLYPIWRKIWRKYHPMS